MTRGDLAVVILCVIAAGLMVLLSGPDRDNGDVTCVMSSGDPCPGFTVDDRPRGPESQEWQP